MKTLLLSTSSSRNAGGLYNSVRNLGQALLNFRGVDPLVLAFNDKNSAVDISAYAPLPIVEYNIIGPPGIAFSLDLKYKIESFDPDITHVQGIYLYSSYINLKYSTKNRKPYIIAPRGMLDPWILSTRAWKKKIGLTLYEREHLKRASCIQALGTPEYKAIRNFGSTNPIAIIPNGVNLPISLTSDNLIIPSWKDHNRKTLLFLSRLHPKKGIENLLLAWSKIGDARNEWQLVIAGESQGDDYLKTLVQLQAKLKLQNDVSFIGPQYHSDKDLCFRNSDAFILPSFGEGMPMSVLEAWSYNLPVLITEGCNIPEGFEFEAAIMIEPDSDSILLGLRRLFNLTDVQIQTMGNNGYKLVKDKFTWPAIAKQVKEVYDWILADRPIPECVKLD